MSIEHRPITPDLGLEVEGLQMADAVRSDDLADEVRALFNQHRVLVLRGQTGDAEDHKAFGRLFGELHIHPSHRTLGVGGDPEIFTVRTSERTKKVNGGRWHMDVSCEAVPPRASILRLTEVPPVGGDTAFADMHRAFELLSPPIQTLLLGLDAFHDGMRDLRWYGIAPEAGQTYPNASHPMITAHPETGRPTLFVNEGFTERVEGLSELESTALLEMLFNWIARTPALQCRVRWEPGTVVMWDNLAVQHHAIWDYQPHARRGERVSVLGTEVPRRWHAPAQYGEVAAGP